MKMHHWNTAVLLTVTTVCSLVLISPKGAVNGRQSEPLVPIQWYTHPDGVEEVNGSHGIDSCDALNTVYDPPQCTSGELTDGVFPQPEDMTTINWAQGFFTVNRGNSTTIEIGFRLERSVVIEEVQLSLLICPAWGIGAPNITLYGAQGTVRTSPLGSITVADDTSCTVQNLTVSFDETFRNYFLVFNCETDLSITWLFLGEVKVICQVTPSSPNLPSTPSPNARESLPSRSVESHSTPTPTLFVTNSSIDESDDSPLTLIFAGIGAAILLLCVIAMMLSAGICYVVRKRRKQGRMSRLEMKGLNSDCNDVVNFQGGSDEEVVNHLYESVVRDAQGPVQSSDKIPVQHNKAYAAAVGPSTYRNSENYYY